MQRYEITGMSCAACASHVEKAVAAVPGVASVAVSLLTNSMQVDYAPDADPDATARRILRAVDAAGYGASLASAESESAELEDTETPKLKKRLIASLCFLVPLMYVSMGHMIGLPLGSAESLYELRSCTVLLLLAVAGATPLAKSLCAAVQRSRAGKTALAVLEPVGLTALLAVCTAFLVDGSFNPFLYFRF